MRQLPSLLLHAPKPCTRGSAMSLLDQVHKLEQQVVDRLKELEPLTREYEQLRKVAERLGLKYSPGSAEDDGAATAKPAKSSDRARSRAGAGKRAARTPAKKQSGRAAARGFGGETRGHVTRYAIRPPASARRAAPRQRAPRARPRRRAQESAPASRPVDGGRRPRVRVSGTTSYCGSSLTTPASRSARSASDSASTGPACTGSPTD